MKVLVIVDMQNDFISGPLGSPEAVVARDNLCKWIKDNITMDDKVIFTKDTHYEDYLGTQEGKNLPIPHCIYETDGWEIDEKLMFTVEHIGPFISIIEKETFGAIGMKNYMPAFPNIVDEIIFCGVCTDICVISNALIMKATYSEIPISVIAKCCAGLTPEKHEAALSVIESCQIKIVRD